MRALAEKTASGEYGLDRWVISRVGCALCFSRTLPVTIKDLDLLGHDSSFQEYQRDIVNLGELDCTRTRIYVLSVKIQ